MNHPTDAGTLVVDSVRGPAFVQDGGRAGFMHHAVPPGGAMIPERLAASNRSIGNAWNAPAIELFGGISLHGTGSSTIVSLDGEPHVLGPGEVFAVLPSHEVSARYLAVAGGFDVPRRLGGYGTLVSVALGGFDGRSLRRGDVLSVSPHGRRAVRVMSASLEPARSIRVLAGPDVARFAPDALDWLTGTTFTVTATTDRIGARLDGPACTRIDADDGASSPMVRGAIEVPAEGHPIVLGPDHPTTGGYPVIAVVVRADHGAFAARRPGASVRFASVRLVEARAAWRELAHRWFQVETVSDGP